MIYGRVELWLVVRVRVRVPLRILSLQVLGELDTCTEQELRLSVTGH
jgi:hypothetical protein